MKKLSLMLLVSFLGVAAQAQVDGIAAQWTDKEVKISYYEHNIFYNCDAVESQVKSDLKELGARDIHQVYCSGGLEMNLDSFQVTAKFQALAPAKPSDANALGMFQTVTFKGRDACGYHTAILSQLFPAFTTQNYVAEENCDRQRGAYAFGAEVLKVINQ